MKVLLIILSDRLREEACKTIQAKYPEKELIAFTKQELAGKSASELIKIFRRQRYFSAIIFSDNLERQTKFIFLKAILLLSKAQDRRFVDIQDEEKKVDLGDFISYLPLFVIEIGLTIIALLGLAFVLTVFSIYLKSAKQGKRKYKNKGSRNVAFLRTEYAFGSHTGGMARYYDGFIKGIKACGYEVLFISNDALKVSDAPVYLIKFWKIFNNFPDTPQLIYNFKYIWDAYKILRKNPPALLFQIADPYNFSGAILASIFKVPFFLNSHDMGMFTGYLQEKIYLKYYTRLIEEVSFLATDAFFPVSSVVKESLLERGAQRKIIIKHMGVDPERFHPEASGKQEVRERYQLENKIVVGYAGSFFTDHGLAVLVEAAKIVLRENTQIHFLLLGDGKCYPAIKQFVEQEGLEDNISLPGSIPLEQVPAHLAACDICVAPYTQEYFGTPSKAFEYMAVQAGVIVTNLKSTREVITDGENGLMVEPGNPRELATAILRLAQDKELRLKLGEQAREDVIKKYTWKAVEGEVIKAYEELISSG